MQQITQQQYDSLVKGIYDTFMSQEDMDLGDMGNCQDAAQFIVDEWLENNKIIPDF